MMFKPNLSFCLYFVLILNNLWAQIPDYYSDIDFNHNNLELKVCGELRKLTSKEADLLQYLIVNRNQLLKREDILTAIWGDDDYFVGRSLDVFISRLRKYLAGTNKVEIVNHHGVGFKLLDKD